MRVPHLLLFLSLLPILVGSSWFPSVFSSVLTVFETAATVGVGLVCPPLAPIVGGALAIGGALLENEVEKAFNKENEEEGQSVVSDEAFNELTWRIEDLEESIAENREIVLDNQNEIRQNREEIFINRNAILDNKELLQQNQRITLQNQDLILQNQDMLVGIQGMINETSEKNMEFMKDLSSSLKTFEFNMKKNFDQLKTFITEMDFTKTVIIPMRTLWQAMVDATEHRTKRTIEEFKRKYAETHALDILESELVTKLDYNNLNPVSSGMLSNPLHSRAILKHYMQMFSQVIVKVIAVEGFYYGITDRSRKETKENMKLLKQKVDRAINEIRKFFINVAIPTDKYWPDEVEQAVIGSNDETNETIVAEKIREKLDGIYTKDAFNIFAFRCEPSKDCKPTTLLRNAPPKQKLMVDEFNKETRVRVVVMRSARHHNASTDDSLLLKAGYRSYKTLIWKLKGNPCDKEPFEAMVNDIIDTEASPLNGFLICDLEGPGAARITNNETAIIEDDDMRGNEKFYYGVSWA